MKKYAGILCNFKKFIEIEEPSLKLCLNESKLSSNLFAMSMCHFENFKWIWKFSKSSGSSFKCLNMAVELYQIRKIWSNLTQRQDSPQPGVKSRRLSALKSADSEIRCFQRKLALIRTAIFSDDFLDLKLGSPAVKHFWLFHMQMKIPKHTRLWSWRNSRLSRVKSDSSSCDQKFLFMKNSLQDSFSTEYILNFWT